MSANSELEMAGVPSVHPDSLNPTRQRLVTKELTDPKTPGISFTRDKETWRIYLAEIEMWPSRKIDKEEKARAVVTWCLD